MIEQWGYIQIGSNSDTSASMTFLVTYNYTPHIATSLRTSSLDRNDRYMFQITALSTSSFTVFGNSARTFGCEYIVNGY